MTPPVPGWMNKAKAAAEAEGQAHGGTLEGLAKEERRRVKNNVPQPTLAMATVPQVEGLDVLVRGRAPRAGQAAVLVHVPEELHDVLQKSGNTRAALLALAEFGLARLREEEKTLMVG